MLSQHALYLCNTPPCCNHMGVLHASKWPCCRNMPCFRATPRHVVTTWRGCTAQNGAAARESVGEAVGRTAMRTVKGEAQDPRTRHHFPFVPSFHFPFVLSLSKHELLELGALRRAQGERRMGLLSANGDGVAQGERGMDRVVRPRKTSPPGSRQPTRSSKKSLTSAKRR